MDFAFLDNGEHAAQAWGLKPPVTQGSLVVAPANSLLKNKKGKSTYKSLSPGKRMHESKDRALGNRQ